MKTQLLEDIGQSATLSLVPSKTIANSQARSPVQESPQARSVRALTGTGNFTVWRQKPADGVVVSTTPADQPPTPLELRNVFDEIAALEAQYVPPQAAREPEIVLGTPRQDFPLPTNEPLADLVNRRAEPTLVPSESPEPSSPQDSLFEFMSAVPDAPEPFTPVAPVFTRTKQRYMIWGASIFSVALLILGGRWIYQNGSEVGKPVADAVEVTPEVDKTVRRRAIAAKEFSLGPNGEVLVTPAVPSRSVPSAPPPLVLLDSAAVDEVRIQSPAPKVEEKVEPQSTQTPASVARTLPAPLPQKEVASIARAQDDTKVQPANESGERGSVRQLARLASVKPKPQLKSDASTTATLKACREHGYNAAQCVKRACSVTKYGFVCRG